MIYFFPHVAAVLQGMDAMVVPPLRGYMSKIVNVEDQGEFFQICIL